MQKARLKVLILFPLLANGMLWGAADPAYCKRRRLEIILRLL